MTDLWIAVMVMVFLGCLLFWVVYCSYGHLSKAGRRLLILSLTAIIVFHMWFLEDSVWIIKLLPFQGVVIYGNLYILTGAALSAILWKWKLAVGKRIILVFLVMLLAWIPIVNQVFGEKPKFQNVWIDGVSRQSSQDSCGAAAAATLVHYYGLETSEKQMAEASLTRQGGSSLCGLYRGLRKVMDGTPYKVIVGKAAIRQLGTQVPLPAILIVGLTGKVNDQEPRYAEKWGFQVGISHSIVVFNIREDGSVEVGDPAVGREIWSHEALVDLWHGTYITVK